MPQNKRHREGGNIFIIILVAVFLFGALIYTFTRSSQKGSGNLSRQQLEIASQEILSYAQAIENSVNLIRQRGCSENQISFDNPINAGYTNAAAPADSSCDVFDENGGQSTYQSPSPIWTNTAQEWEFNANLQITDLGTTCAGPSCADLAIHLADIPNDLCTQINNELRLGAATIPVDSDYEFGAFTGSFDTTPTDIADEINSAILAERATGCLASTADSENYFYHILMVR